MLLLYRICIIFDVVMICHTQKPSSDFNNGLNFDAALITEKNRFLRSLEKSVYLSLNFRVSS